MSFFALLRRSSWSGLLPWQLLILVVLLTSYWPSPECVPRSLWLEASGPSFLQALSGLWWFLLLPLLRLPIVGYVLEPYPGEFEFLLPLDPGRLMCVRFLALNLAWLAAPLLYVGLLLLTYAEIRAWGSTEWIKALGQSCFVLSLAAVLPVWLQHASLQRGVASHRLQLIAIFFIYLVLTLLYAFIPLQRPEAPVHWIGFLALAIAIGLQASTLRRCMQPVEYAGIGSEPDRWINSRSFTHPVRTHGAKAVRYLFSQRIRRDQSWLPAVFVGQFLLYVVMKGETLPVLLVWLLLFHHLHEVALHRINPLGCLPVSASKLGKEILRNPVFPMVGLLLWCLLMVLVSDDRGFNRTSLTKRIFSESEGARGKDGYYIQGRMGWPAFGWGDSVWFSGGKKAVSSQERVHFLGPVLPLWVQGSVRLPLTVPPETVAQIMQSRIQAGFGVRLPAAALERTIQSAGGGVEQGSIDGVSWERGGGRLDISAGGAGGTLKRALMILTLLIWSYALLVVRVFPRRRYPMRHGSRWKARLAVLTIVSVIWILHRLESQSPGSYSSAEQALVSLMPSLYFLWLLPLCSGWFLVRLIHRRTQAFEVPSQPLPGLTDSWLGPRGEWRSIRPLFSPVDLEGSSVDMAGRG